MNRVFNWRKGYLSPLYLPLQEDWHLRPVSLGLAALIAAKTKEDYSQVMCNIRTRLSMDIMRIN